MTIGDLISVKHNGTLYDGCYIRKEKGSRRHHVVVLDNSPRGFKVMKVYDEQIGNSVIGYHRDKPIEGYEY